MACSFCFENCFFTYAEGISYNLPSHKNFIALEDCEMLVIQKEKLQLIFSLNREVLHIESDLSLPTVRVIRVLEYLKEFRGLPQMIRVDNGPEFISHKLNVWCREQRINLTFIQPGKPMQNGFIERCNGNIRKELLDAYIFTTLNEVRQKTEEWRMDYNTSRPHKSLGYVAPQEFVFNPFS